MMTRRPPRPIIASLLASPLLAAALSACSSPPPPPPPAQDHALRDAIKQPIDRARQVEAMQQQADAERRRQIDAAGE